MVPQGCKLTCSQNQLCKALVSVCAVCQKGEGEEWGFSSVWIYGADKISSATTAVSGVPSAVFAAQADLEMFSC